MAKNSLNKMIRLLLTTEIPFHCRNTVPHNLSVDISKRPYFLILFSWETPDQNYHPEELMRHFQYQDSNIKIQPGNGFLRLDYRYYYLYTTVQCKNKQIYQLYRQIFQYLDNFRQFQYELQIDYQSVKQSLQKLHNVKLALNTKLPKINNTQALFKYYLQHHPTSISPILLTALKGTSKEFCT